LSALTDGTPLLGHVAGEPTVVVRHGDDVFAVGAQCTHYGGPLAAGPVGGETIRCPWHHACFSLRSAEALPAPALTPIPCRTVEQRDGMVYVGGPVPAARSPRAGTAAGETRSKAIVIVGAGAAGSAAAEMLRRQQHRGPITLLSADESPPCDRPNLSKNYLAG